ncbi:MAG: diguanylate cyclase domain-containing protein [Chloroflexota bacterium]
MFRNTNQGPKAKAVETLRHIFAGIVGAFLLCVFSLVQKALVSVSIPITTRTFIIPVLFGGATGLIISFLFTKLRQANERLEQNWQHLIDFMDNASDLIQSVGPHGELLYTNQTWRDTLRYNQEDLQKLNLFDIIAKEDREHCRQQLKTVFEGKTIFVRFAMMTKIGEKVYVEGFTNCRFENGQPVSTRSILRNITANQHNEEALRLAAKVFERASEGIYVANPEGRIITVNEAFTRITGFSQQDVNQQRPTIFIHQENSLKTILDSLHDAILLGKDWQGELPAHRKNGETFPALIQVIAVTDQEGAIENYIGFLTDITARKETDERLQHLATHDVLTGLPNRILFIDRLQSALWRAEQSGNMVAVLFLDLDGFKTVNDQLGHQMGDEFLRVIAKRLQASIKITDSAARMGGDEFAVLLQNISSQEDALHATERLLAMISKPVSLKENKVQTTASIGISIYPEHGTQESLLASADQAMYLAKSKGKNCYYLFTADEQGNSKESSPKKGT